MSIAAPPVSSTVQLSTHTESLARWLRTHRSSLVMAGLLAFAGPVTFFTGALSVMRAPTTADLVRLGLWWMLYALSLWCLLLVAGYGCERLAARRGEYLRGAIRLPAACLAAALPNVLTAPRVSILIEQGLVHSALTAHLYAFTFSLVMALLYFEHLRRSRAHEQAAARLAAAQAAQRDARRRIVEARLQELQARIDPQTLFETLDTVRHLYERDAVQAERFLDELIVFLRAALPRLRTASSSLLREVELARAFVRLHALAGVAPAADAPDLSIEVAPDMLHARLPPGVLLPLLDGIAHSGGNPASCRLTAVRWNGSCRLVLTMTRAPSDHAVARVQSLLSELYGAAGKLEIENKATPINVIVKVPYELA
jgi:hypothetical protein